MTVLGREIELVTRQPYESGLATGQRYVSIPALACSWCCGDIPLVTLAGGEQIRCTYCGRAARVTKRSFVVATRAREGEL